MTEPTNGNEPGHNAAKRMGVGLAIAVVAAIIITVVGIWLLRH